MHAADEDVAILTTQWASQNTIIAVDVRQSLKAPTPLPLTPLLTADTDPWVAVKQGVQGACSWSLAALRNGLLVANMVRYEPLHMQEA